MSTFTRWSWMSKRNTACTAWLCGIQGFLFDQVGVLDEWNRLWNEIPGQMFRRDITPDKVWITSFIDTKKLDSRAGELLAEVNKKVEI